MKTTTIKYSCISGQAVWLYQGPTKKAMLRSYYRTVERERKRKRQWPKVQQRWREDITRLLDECIAALSLMGDLTKVQREAIKTLRTMADNPPEFVSPMLDHDRERRHQNRLKARRQRYWKDAAYRQQEKERLRERRRKIKQEENKLNMNYDK